MSYNKTELKTLQQIEIEMLMQIKKICEQNNIEYFLLGGTALGAQRHEGFIPWDDDIDIGMTRDNYNKFLKITSHIKLDGYFIQTPETDSNTPFPYVKFRKNNTKFIEWCNRNIDMHQGIYIDIFPYDNIPDSEDLRYKQFKKVQILSKMYTWRQTPDISHSSQSIFDIIKSLSRKLVYLTLRIIPRKILIRALDKELNRYNKEDTLSRSCLFFPKYMVEYMTNDTLYPLKMKSFEGDKYPVPGDIDNYLKTHYGDYMKLPPIEQQIGHRPYKVEF